MILILTFDITSLKLNSIELTENNRCFKGLKFWGASLFGGEGVELLIVIGEAGKSNR